MLLFEYFSWLIGEVKTAAIDAELVAKANLKQCVRQWPERRIDLAMDIYLWSLFDVERYI